MLALKTKTYHLNTFKKRLCLTVEIAPNCLKTRVAFTRWCVWHFEYECVPWRREWICTYNVHSRICSEFWVNYSVNGWVNVEMNCGVCFTETHCKIHSKSLKIRLQTHSKFTQSSFNIHLQISLKITQNSLKLRRQNSVQSRVKIQWPDS